MADSIPLNPVRKNSKRIPYYNSARHSRYSLEDEPSNLDEMPLMMSEEGFENDESDYQTLPRARVNHRHRGLGWFLCGGWKVLCGRYSLEDEPSNLDEMPLMMSEEGFENDESDYQTLPRARVNHRHRGLGGFLCGGWKVLCGR
ncbi:probable phospholipid-transporting ATPase IIB [Seriola dumerili]|uniref:probable phospholipid-transporting ATPase IIB n=1 Tax=Seriola dumerili TaxID=41447 RepID=UPI000BBF268F|nr:probable phospholipid-transporting ATPase IIB [Seriola dumerili]